MLTLSISRSKLCIFFGILFLILGGWFIFKKQHSLSVRPEIAVPVEVASVQQRNIPIELHTIGSLVAAKNVQITAEIAGPIARIFFQDGAFVKEGTPLVQLDDAVYKAKLESAKASLLYSETDYGRKKLLGKQGAIAQQAIDQALADFKEKQAAVAETQVMLDKTLLRAPFDGVLGKTKVSPGDHVSVGQNLVSLTDVEHLHVEYSVPEKYWSQLKLGQTVKLTTNAYANQEFNGKIAYISPTISAEDRTISVYADLPNQAGLLTAGLFVNVTHELSIEQNAMIVPATSLVPLIDGQQVFKVVNHKAIAIPVEILQRTKDEVQVPASHLKAGDLVVIAGQQQLKDGSPVQFQSAP